MLTPDRDYHGHRDDPAGLADLQVGGVDPQIRPGALDRPAQEGVHPLVDLLAQAADLALRHPGRAHRLDEIVDSPRRDPVHVGLLDYGRERLLGGAPGLEEGGEVGALAELGDGQVDPAGPRLPAPLAVAIPVFEAVGAARAGRRTGLRLNLQLHHAIGRKGQQLAHEVRIRPLLDQLDQGHSLVGHRRLRSGSSFATRTLTEDRR